MKDVSVKAVEQIEVEINKRLSLHIFKRQKVGRLGRVWGPICRQVYFEVYWQVRDSLKL